jgi:hypothetical protein
MVRIQSRIAKTRYLNNKRVYKHERRNLPVPKKFHKATASFLKLDLEMQLVVKGRKIFIELEDRKSNLDSAKSKSS